MKRLITAIFFISSLTTAGQSPVPLRQRVEQYLEASCRIDVSSLLDLIYPPLISMTTRKVMEEELLEAFNSPDLAIKIQECRLDSIRPAFNVREGSYVKIDYSFTMTMTFLDDSSDLRELGELMKAQFGPNTQYDPEKRTLTVPVKTDMLGLLNEHSPEWTFLDYKKLREAYPDLLDADIWTKLED